MKQCNFYHTVSCRDRAFLHFNNVMCSKTHPGRYFISTRDTSVVCKDRILWEVRFAQRNLPTVLDSLLKTSFGCPHLLNELPMANKCFYPVGVRTESGIPSPPWIKSSSLATARGPQTIPNVCLLKSKMWITL